jgi:TRAP-type mannitol/chloroaromatic compound transport system substrate-binding protein
MDRRKFLKNTGAAAGLVGTGLLAGCQDQQTADCDAGSVSAAETYNWKMVMSWPKDFPGLGTGANHLAENIRRLSGGRMNIKVYGAGELVPPFEVFDTVSRGTAEMGHSAAYYWKGKAPASQIFTGVPFGMTAQEQNGWFYYGGGLDLWREIYAPHNLVPFPAGNSGTQMGGWFNKEINGVADLKGLKMRIPGLGAEVLKLAGGTPQNTPGPEIFTALQTGTIDATEWVGPLNDLAFGLFRAARYYYYPGWHEPGTTLEVMVNKEVFESLPEDLQAVVEIACQAANLDMQSEFMARNVDSLNTLVEEHGVELRQFPDEVIDYLQELTEVVLQNQADEDADFARVYASYSDFRKKVESWSAISEQHYMNQRR